MLVLVAVTYTFGRSASSKQSEVSLSRLLDQGWCSALVKYRQLDNCLLTRSVCKKLGSILN